MRLAAVHTTFHKLGATTFHELGAYKMEILFAQDDDKLESAVAICQHI